MSWVKSPGMLVLWGISAPPSKGREVWTTSLKPQGKTEAGPVTLSQTPAGTLRLIFDPSPSLLLPSDPLALATRSGRTMVELVRVRGENPFLESEYK